VLVMGRTGSPCSVVVGGGGLSQLCTVCGSAAKGGR
jgi:hypothetical protein